MSVHDFDKIESLEVGKTIVSTIGIDFNDSTQGVKIQIEWKTEIERKKHTITINANIGEQIRPVTMSESLFLAEQGKA